MPKIRDKTTITWIVDGETIDEDVIFYDDDDDVVDFEDIEDIIIADDETLDHDIIQQLDLIILNDCLEKIAILKGIAQKEFQPCSLKYPTYRSIEDRFGEKIGYGDEFYSEDRKRFMDLTLIYSILFKTVEDVCRNGVFTSLIHGISILKRLRDDEDDLFKHEIETRECEADLKTKLLTQAASLDSKYKEKLETLRQLELLHEEAIGYGTLEYKYMTKWEASRRHQGNLTLENCENYYLDIISSCRVKTTLENKVHCETVRYFEESQEDMQNSIQYWMDHYEEEVEIRDSELLRMKMEREQQLETIEQMKKTYEEHEEFIKYWGAIKEERRLAAERALAEMAAAIKIQAWWRGVMVRKHLGRFRRRRKGKGKGKDKGGGKKKAKPNANKKKK